MKKVRNIFIVLAIVIAGYVSTYGWHEPKKSISSYSLQDETLSKGLKQHVYVLSDQLGWRSPEQSDNLQKSASYIHEYFRQLGFEVQTQQFFAKGKPVSNIIAQKKGKQNPSKIILVGAHYDSYFNPGADNNSSGIAALLELARIVSREDFNCTIRFAAFVNGEPPFFGTNEMGSYIYIERSKLKGENIDSVIILDSIGFYSSEKHSQRYPLLLGFLYPNSANFIAVVANNKSFALQKTAVSFLKKNTSMVIEGFVGFDFINSDHWNFWKNGYRTILITDTGSYRNPNYYSLSDTYLTLNYLNMAQIVQGLQTLVELLAN